MKILVIGLGSMGKRRIRNLLKLGYTDIIGFDPHKDRRDETTKKYLIPTVSNINDGLEKNPTVMIISTPPDLHATYANLALEKNINFFTEVNLSSKEIKNIVKKLNNKSIVGVPSCTMLFHPVMKKLKNLMRQKSIGKILTVYHHFGQYLPDWHPWEDYRNFYVSKRETGAAREVVPFELVWLTSLFSDVKSVYGSIDKVSKLNADIDDLYQIILEFKNGVRCVLIIDVVSRPPFSETKIIGEKGVILCDYNKGVIRLSKGKEWKTLKLKMGIRAKGYKGNTSAESLYEEEMNIFLDTVKGRKKYPHPFHNELKILQTLDAIEISNKKGKKIIIK